MCSSQTARRNAPDMSLEARPRQMFVLGVPESVMCPSDLPPPAEGTWRTHSILAFILISCIIPQADPSCQYGAFADDFLIWSRLFTVKLTTKCGLDGTDDDILSELSCPSSMPPPATCSAWPTSHIPGSPSVGIALASRPPDPSRRASPLPSGHRNPCGRHRNNY
jgi:hypothetical protein